MLGLAVNPKNHPPVPVAKGMLGLVRHSEGRTLQMAATYEDNFGFWDIDGPEERAFFDHIKRQSVFVNCER